MGGAVSMIGGAVVNAVAFTGSGYLFNKLGQDKKRSEEYKRHNLALEKVSREKLEYEKYRMKIAEELRDQGIALKDFKTLGEAMDQYHKVTGIELMSFKTYNSKYQGANDDGDESDNNEIIELVLVLGGVYTTILIFYRYY